MGNLATSQDVHFHALLRESVFLFFPDCATVFPPSHPLASYSSSVPSLRMENRAGNLVLQDTLFAAANSASTQELKVIAILSFSTVPSPSSFKSPSLTFPFRCPFQGNSWEAAVFMNSTCPIHVHLLFLTSSLMVSVLALLHTSSLDTRIGQ